MGYLIHLVRGEAAVQRLLYHAKALYPAEFKRAAYAVKIAAEADVLPSATMSTPALSAI